MGNKTDSSSGTLLQELQARVDAWIVASPQTRNLAVLARRLNYTDSTVRRMLSGECKLSFEAVSLMLQEVCNSRQAMHDILAKHYPDILGRLLPKGEYDQVERKNDSDFPDLNRFAEALKDGLGFKIWTLALSEQFSLDYVKGELGNQGFRTCEKLIDEGLLEINSGGNISVSRQHRCLELNLRLSSVIYNNSVDHAEKAEHQSFFNNVFWVDYNTFKEVYRLSVEYQENMNKIGMDSSKARGCIPIAVNQLLTRLDTSDIDYSTVKELAK